MSKQMKYGDSKHCRTKPIKRSVQTRYNIENRVCVDIILTWTIGVANYYYCTHPKLVKVACRGCLGLGPTRIRFALANKHRKSGQAFQAREYGI